MPVKPFKYQKEGILDMEDFLGAHGGVLLGDDMGLGKTLQTLWLLRRQRPGPMFPALVVCPASVKYNWEHCALEHVGIRAQVLEGRKPLTTGFTQTIPKITIINVDILSPWLPYLNTVGFRSLVLDECQNFSNPTNKRTKAAIELARSIPFKIALSGTPLMNAPHELWPTLYMLREDIFGSLFSFGEDFSYRKKRYGKWRYTGARNLDKLHPLLRRTCMVRRRKEDVLKDLPDKLRCVVPLEIDKREEYNYAVTDFKGWLRKNYRDDQGRVNRALRSIAVTRVGYLVRLAAKLKARAVVGWANRWLEAYPNEKLILFTIHHKMNDVLKRRVQAESIVIDGSVRGRDRKNAVNMFCKDSKTRVLIGNIRSMGVGVDGLQDVCNTAAFAEMWWVPGAHVQAEDRIYRIGQETTAFINYLVAVGTIEERLCNVVQDKQKTINATLDGKTFDGDMNVMDQLIAALEGN